MKELIALGLALLILSVVSAQEVDYSNSYILDGTSLVEWIGEEAEINMQADSILRTVTKIEDSAFRENSSLLSITFSERLQSIGNRAFAFCYSLSEVNFPEKSNLYSIGNSVFENCSSLESLVLSDEIMQIGTEAFNACASLKSITLPANLLNVGAYVFLYCRSLEKIYIREDNLNFCTKENVLFNKNMTELICYPAAKPEDSYIPPSSLKKIEKGAFFGNPFLKTISLPSRIERIADKAFESCTALEKLSCFSQFPPSFGLNAFSDISANPILYVNKETLQYYRNNMYCVRMFDVQIMPEGYKGSYLMSGTCLIEWFGHETSIDMQNDVNLRKLSAIADRAFSSCISLKNISLPVGLTNIGDSVFFECKELSSIKCFVSSPPSLGNGAFASDPKNKTYVYVLPEVLSSFKEQPEWSDKFEIKEIVMDYSDSYLIEDSTLVKWIGEEPNLFLQTDKNLNKVSVIGGSAFFSNTNLNHISLPKNIRTIDKYAFSGCTSLESVSFSDSLVSIGDWAFNDCPNLLNIDLPTKLTDIGIGAFNKCTSLKQIYLPASVQNLGFFALSSCSSLEEISVDSENKDFSSDNGVLYNLDKTELIRYPPAKIDKTFLIPSTVTRLGEASFNICSNLTSLTIPKTIESIGAYALFSCSLLTKIEVQEGNKHFVSDKGVLYNFDKTDLICYPPAKPDISYKAQSGLKYINDFAFYGSSYLEDVKLPKSLVVIGKGAFYRSKALKSVDFSDGEELINIEEFAFSDCSSLTNIKFPTSLKTIGKAAFSNCSSILSFDIGKENVHFSSDNGVLFDKQKTQLLYYPAGLEDESYAFPSSLAGIENYAFSGSNNITNLNFPASLASIGKYAFSNCSSLKEITFPDKAKLRTIDEAAFLNCKSLTSIMCPPSLLSINNKAFYGCESLESLMFSEDSSLEDIGEEAFRNCESLSNVSLPKSLLKIDNKAFYNSTALNSLMLPTNIEEIGDYAFANCTNLNVLACLTKNPPSLGVKSYKGIAKNAILFVKPESINKFASNSLWKEQFSIKEMKTGTSSNKSSEDAVAIWSSKGAICVISKEKVNFCVYNLGGKEMYCNQVSGKDSVSLPLGTYFVVLDNVGFKMNHFND